MRPQKGVELSIFSDVGLAAVEYYFKMFYLFMLWKICKDVLRSFFLNFIN